MKKAIALILSLMLILAISLPAAAITATKKVAAPKNNVTLTWYVIGNRNEPDTAKVCAAVNKYLKDKINITLKLTTLGFGDTYDKKINPMLASGQKFDLVFTAAWAANYRNNASSGYFTDLTKMLKSSPITQVLGKDFLNGSAVNGKNFGVPANKEKAHNWGVLLLKSMVDKYKVNISKIKSLKDLEPTFDAIKKGEPGMTPLLAVNMDAPWHLLDWDNLSDDDIPGAFYNDNRGTTVINQFIAPEAIAQYKKMNQYYQKGWIHPDAATMDNFADQMKTGKYFCAVQPLKPGKDIEMNNSTGQKWVQVDLTPVVMTNRETTGAMTAIPAASKNKDRAFKFLELLYTDKTLVNMLEYGLPNVHYTKVSANVVKPLGGDKATYNPGHNWRYGNQFINWLTPDQDPQIWNLFEKYNKKAVPLRSLGFVYDNKDSATQASACKAVIQQYYKELFTGAAADTDATVASMKSDLEAAGVNELIADMQKQFNAWLKATGKK
jgi:putative aldouronate transport system substrate-binding protein